MTRVFFAVITAALLFCLPACSGNKQVRKAQDSALEAEALRHSTRFQRNFSLARYSLALDEILRAEAIYDALDMDNERAISLNNAGVVLERLGKKTQAESAYRESLSLADSGGDTRTAVAARNNLAGILVGKNPDQALVLAREAEKTSRRNGWPSPQAKAVHTMAVLAMDAGNPGDAEELVQQALHLAAQGGSRGTQSACLVTLSRITAESGDLEAAMELVNKAIALDRDRKDPFSIGRDYEARAFIQEKGGDLEGALESREKGARIMEFLGLESEEPVISNQ